MSLPHPEETELAVFGFQGPWALSQRSHIQRETNSKEQQNSARRAMFMICSSHWTKPWECKHIYCVWTPQCATASPFGGKGLAPGCWECCWQKALSSRPLQGLPEHRGPAHSQSSPRCIADQRGGQHSHPNMGQFRSHSNLRTAHRLA